MMLTLEIIGRNVLEMHLRSLAENGLISAQEARDVVQRLKNAYQESEERLTPTKERREGNIPASFLEHLHAARYIRNIIQKKIDETNLVITTFVEMWNAGQIGNGESRIVIEKAVERKKDLERLHDAAQKRNQLEFENEIWRIRSFSNEIEEIEKNDDQMKLEEKSEAIRASITESLSLLAKSKAELDSYTQQLNQFLATAQKTIDSKEPDPARSKRITKRIENLIDAVREHHLSIENILSKQSQFEFETVLAKGVVAEDCEQEILTSLIAHLEDTGNIPAKFNQDDVIAEILSSLHYSEVSPQEEPENLPNISLDPQTLESPPLSEETERQEDHIPPLDNNAILGASIAEERTVESVDDEIVGPWSFAGSILLTSTDKLIGICTEPLAASNGKIYLKCVKEEDIDLEKSDQIFREMSMILKGASDSSLARKEILRKEIAETLKLPPQLALKPTFVREYFGKKHVVALKLPIELDLAVKSIEYYPYESLIMDEIQGVTKLVSGSGTTDIEGRLVPSSWRGEIPAQKLPIKRFDGSNLGVVRSLFTSVSFGTFIVVEIDKPSPDLCTEIHQQVGSSSSSFSKSPGVWSLRFLIARRLDGVFEGEALLYWNVWKYIWQEQVPILPWDLRMDYVGLIPAGAVAGIENSELYLKRRIEPHQISAAIPFSDSSAVLLNGRRIGRFVGYDLDENGMPGILVSSKSTGEILAGVGRDTSENYVRRLGARISKALGIPVEQAMSPGAIVRYLLFFVRLVDVPTFAEAMAWLGEHLGLQSYPLSQIETTPDAAINILSEK